MNQSVKKVTFITISMAGGGTERVISTLANHYVQSGIDVDILMIGGKEVAYMLDKKIRLLQVSDATNGSLMGRLKRISAISRNIESTGDELVIAMGTVASMFACLALMFKKVRLVISERNDPNRLNHRPIKWYEKMIRNLLYLRSNAIVFQTKMAQEQFPKALRRKSVIIANPLQLKENIARFNPKKKIILSAGRLTSQKNFSLLIKAFANFYKNNQEYELHIYGDGELRTSLQEEIDQYGISNVAFLKGYTDSLNDKMMESEIYVSSSNWEGVSNTLMEAMGYGMAVIATDCPMGGSATLIINDYNGKLIPVNDCDSLTAALAELSENVSLKQQFSSNATKIAETMNVEEIAKKWIDIAI